ncbi:MAG: hypothetical protein NTW19_19725 [Planctomycetota bacterium]|nr:hypothetical protein [Planctomycetota bacterium]
MKPGRRRVICVIFNGLTLASILMFVVVAGLWARNISWATTERLWLVHLATTGPFTSVTDGEYVLFEDGLVTMGWSHIPISWSQRLTNCSVRHGSHRRTAPSTIWTPLAIGGIHASNGDDFEVAIADWFLLFLFSILPLAWLVRHRRRPQPGHCTRCGYDLRASPSACPECGEPSPAKEAKIPASS